MHTAERCKCHLPIHMLGQDESIYWQYLLSNKVWYINGACGLRKKGNGPGIMTSAFVSEQFGFGMPLTPTQLAKVNAWRKSQMGPEPSDAMKERYKPLTESPALRFLKYGKNQDGWWNYQTMAQQCEGRYVVFMITSFTQPPNQPSNLNDRFDGRTRSPVAQRPDCWYLRLVYGACEISRRRLGCSQVKVRLHLKTSTHMS